MYDGILTKPMGFISLQVFSDPAVQPGFPSDSESRAADCDGVAAEVRAALLAQCVLTAWTEHIWRL